MTGQRYTVFLNDRLIEISEDINSTDYQANKRIIAFKQNTQLGLEYERFRTDIHCEGLLIYSDQFYNEAVKTFNSLFKPVKAAGGIVKNSVGEILFIRRLGLWDLPKGKIEENERPDEAARREVSEETGISQLSILRPLPSTFHIYADHKGHEVLKETSWFEMFATGNEKPLPQAEENITAAVWLSHQQSVEAIKDTYASLRQLIGHYLYEDKTAEFTE